MFQFPPYVGLTQSPGNSSLVVSIQPISITIANSATSGTATITSVNTSNAVLFYNGQSNNAATSSPDVGMARIDLTNATTVTATRQSQNGSDTITIKGTVVEFSSAAIQSIQAGTITIGSGNTSNTATITSITTANAFVIYLGVSGTSTTANTGPRYQTRLTITDATTVTASRNTGTDAVTVGYMVVELKSAIVQSIQQISKTLITGNASDTQTITSVTTGNSITVWGGLTTVNTGFANYQYNVQLTAATTLTFARVGTSTNSRTINVTVVELVTGKLNSKQTGTTALVNAASASTTITAVSTSKAFANYLGFKSDVSDTFDNANTAINLASTTSITSSKGAAGTLTITTGWEVPEFK